MASDLLRALSSFDPSQCSSEAQRVEIIAATQALSAKMQTPTERMINMTCIATTQNIVLRILLDKKFFEKWQQNGDGPKSVQELAQLTDIETGLLRRLLVFLVSQHFLDQVDEDTFAFSKTTAILAEPTAYSWSAFFYGLIAPLTEGMPSFFRKFGYKPPTDPVNGIYQHSLDQPGKHLFQIFASRPEFAAHFNVCMIEWVKYRTYWLDIYPSENLIDESKNPILVDVAGGVGHDVERFNQKYPGHMDRLALAERPEVAARAICNKAIKVIDHDFFTPMPIHGARAYYFKSTIHNWSDENAIKILQNIKSAMTPGYSKILINDIVMPRMKPNGFRTMLDLLMMALPGALERTESQWRSVVNAAGLELVRIWSSPTAEESIIEIEVPTAEAK